MAKILKYRLIAHLVSCIQILSEIFSPNLIFGHLSMYLYCDTIRILVGEHYNCDDIQKLVLGCYVAYNFCKKRLVISC